jgi:hypothetical protein
MARSGQTNDLGRFNVLEKGLSRQTINAKAEEKGR